MVETYYANIEADVVSNPAYRRVMYTDPYLQLVYMSLKPTEEIEMEIHAVTQFFRIESGNGVAIIDGISYELGDGTSFIVPAGHQHYVRNTSSTNALKLYTIYAPPQHDPYTYQLTKP